MQQSPPQEADSSSTDQEIPCIFYNLKLHYFNHNSSPLVPVLSQINPVHVLTSNFFMIHFNIILPPSPRFS